MGMLVLRGWDTPTAYPLSSQLVVPGHVPVLARLIDDRPAFDPRAWMAQLPPMDLYGALLFQVTGQQLSVAATRRTLARIEALSTAISPHPPNYWESIPLGSAKPGSRGGRSTHSVTSPSDCRMAG